MNPSSIRVSVLFALVFVLASPTVWAAKAPSTRGALKPLLLKDLRSRPSGTSFDSVLDRWAADFGSEAVRPLLQIAADKAVAEPQRYIALMGATRLGGVAVAPSLKPFLKDNSWMLRSGAIRALTITKDPSGAQAILSLLKDKALVVRSEAVEAVRKLKPTGAAQALAEAALHASNYHGGKAQWVPVQAVAALREFGAAGAQEQLKKLLPLLEKKNDEALLEETVATFEYLGKKTLAAGEPLMVRAAAWRKEFAQR